MTDAAALLIDFGSTYTKLRAIDMEHRAIIGSGQGPSTVTSDVGIGMRLALTDLERRLGPQPAFRYRLASSSAAGGLRMVTVGLVKELTAEAARRAALGAGAKLVGAYAYQLTRGDLREIVALTPDILLLSGGTDGGNSQVILHNARMLAESPLGCPIVVAGNRAVGDEIAELFHGTGKTAMLTGNVMPEFGRLDIEPARAAIRQVFIDRIVHAKGIDRAREMFDRVLMPTPAAVLEGATLLAQGTARTQGLGTVLVVDIGGATTDVHSICGGEPAGADIVLYGLPEPYAKRTVEGDLGMRHNALAILDTVGAEALAAEACVPQGVLADTVSAFAHDVGRLPATPEEHAVDRALARAAVRLAVKRHAGTVETVYTAMGPATMQRGKDLGGIEAVIGTGGPVVHAAQPRAILEAALFDPADPCSLRPKNPRFLLDRHYVLYAVGLLAEAEPEAALAVGLAHLSELPEGAAACGGHKGGHF
jgi:uncharacterized protein (TIGR01319 family)